MKHCRTACAILICVVLSACATPYQSPGFTGGVIARKDADGTWLILAAGNGHTTVEAISDYTYLKAAETVKAQGFVCFDIVGEYAALREETIPSQYGSNTFLKPEGRLRIRIREDNPSCDEKTNADALIARLGPKVKDPKAYPFR